MVPTIRVNQARRWKFFMQTCFFNIYLKLLFCRTGGIFWICLFFFVKSTAFVASGRFVTCFPFFRLSRAFHITLTTCLSPLLKDRNQYYLRSILLLDLLQDRVCCSHLYRHSLTSRDHSDQNCRLSSPLSLRKHLTTYYLRPGLSVCHRLWAHPSSPRSLSFRCQQ